MLKKGFLGKVLSVEKKEHDNLYSSQQKALLSKPMTWSFFNKKFCIAPHNSGTLYGYDTRIFSEMIENEIRNNEDLRILDYACGTGILGIAVASLGHRVNGFDLSSQGVKVARKLADLTKVSDKTEFV